MPVRGRRGTSRREFLKSAAAGSAAVLARPPAAAAAPAASAPPRPARGAFSAAERRALEALADHVLPGAAALGAIDYVEALLAAFDHDPPRIHAGAVLRGEEFLPLDRVRERGWRLRLFGSAAVPDPAAPVRGPVTGLRPLLLAEARRAVGLGAGDASPGFVWWRLSEEFRQRFGELVLEACLGDPIYGGNRDGRGWRAFHFAAPPLAYGSSAPASHRDHAAADASPLGPVTRACLWTMGFFSRRLVD